jgi:hypothetical protein
MDLGQWGYLFGKKVTDRDNFAFTRFGHYFKNFPRLVAGYSFEIPK